MTVSSKIVGPAKFIILVSIHLNIMVHHIQLYIQYIYIYFVYIHMNCNSNVNSFLINIRCVQLGVLFEARANDESGASAQIGKRLKAPFEPNFPSGGVMLVGGLGVSYCRDQDNHLWQTCGKDYLEIEIISCWRQDISSHVPSSSWGSAP